MRGIALFAERMNWAGELRSSTNGAYNPQSSGNLFPQAMVLQHPAGDRGDWWEGGNPRSA
ncbi:MAG: hypothetical protein DMG36_06410 [Acidobacteria bacterium]|nr:MAG: hypothetical protein DMG36_06410 [Acidobacteriota bacterium]